MSFVAFSLTPLFRLSSMNPVPRIQSTTTKTEFAILKQPEEIEKGTNRPNIGHYLRPLIIKNAVFMHSKRE